MPSTHTSSPSAASKMASPRPSSDSYDDISIMKEEQAHTEHKSSSSSGLSGALKKVKAKFHSESPKPKPKSPYTRDMKLADTVFAYRVLAETRM